MQTEPPRRDLGELSVELTGNAVLTERQQVSTPDQLPTDLVSDLSRGVRETGLEDALSEPDGY
jgi:hypothetical protein